MHQEILTEEQKKLLPLLSKFSNDFGLVGGTAVALQIGHRESLDFDMFSLEEFDVRKIKRNVKLEHSINKTVRDEVGQYTFLIGEIQFTFFHYPYPIDFSKKLDNIVNMPDLLTLAAMKIFALGRRAKWKDYVDLYFIIKDFHSLDEIINKAEKIFENEFNEKIIKEQLSYFEDINYSEEIIFKEGFEIDDETIKKELIEFSLS